MLKEQTTRQPVNKSTGQLMSLGDFVFENKGLPYSQIARQNDYRHASSDRVGAPPAYQSIGPGAETITLSGVVYSDFGNRQQLDTLRDMARAGEAYALVDVSGLVYGLYVVNTVTETGSYFDARGVPKRTEFSVALTRVDGVAHESSAGAKA